MAILGLSTSTSESPLLLKNIQRDLSYSVSANCLTMSATMYSWQQVAQNTDGLIVTSIISDKVYTLVIRHISGLYAIYLYEKRTVNL